MIKTVILDIDATLYEWAALDPVVVREYMGPYVNAHFGWTVEEYSRRLREATDELVAFSGTTGDCCALQVAASMKKRPIPIMVLPDIIFQNSIQPLLAWLMLPYIAACVPAPWKSWHNPAL